MMNKASPYIAAGLFLTAVIARILLPGDQSHLEEQLSQHDAGAESLTMWSESPAEPTVRVINAAERLRDDRYAAASELPEAVEQAVETFMDAQAEFEDLAVPANVSYDVPSISFPFLRPVRAETSSPFGYRVHPLENLTKFHYGVDLAALSGDDIFCFADGVVSEVGEDEEFGRYIRVDHADGVSTMYAHCGTIYVSKGQSVRMGDKLALVGVSGKVTGPNLHFELMRNGVYLNPEFYLAVV